MIEIMTDMPEGTLGFRVAGNVTRDDLAKVVVPMLRGAIERNQPLRVLCQIDAGFSEEPGAVREGVKADIELGIAHRTAWRRTAYVTEPYVDRHERASAVLADTRRGTGIPAARTGRSQGLDQRIAPLGKKPATFGPANTERGSTLRTPSSGIGHALPRCA